MRLEDEIKQKNFKNEYEKGIINLIYTYNWMDTRMKTFFKVYDITPQQFNILRILRGQHPRPCTVNLLKDRMLDKMSDASRIVERLRIKKLLVRNVSSTDRRSVDIMIAQAGLDLLGKLDVDIDQVHKELFANLTKEEAFQLNALLDKLRG